jgi:hypothetical protein
MKTEVRVVEPVAAPAEKVWALIRGFGDLMQWAQGVESCTLEGSGVGAVRTVGLPGGLKLRERLESLDDAKRCFSYSIVGKTPLPFEAYLSKLEIRETGAAACELRWEGSFEPASGREAAAQQLVRGIYTSSIAALRKKLGV